MRSYGKFKIFWDVEFDAYSQGHLANLKETIRSQTQDYILNVNSADYLDHLASGVTQNRPMRVSSKPANESKSLGR